MELRCGSVIYTLRHQPFVVTDEFGLASVLSVSNRERHTLVGALAPQIHNSAKYVFDSGSDQDPETVQAVRDTSVNMMQFDLFHLPHPVIWIEDPFDDNAEFKLARNYYLATEHKGHIDILLFQEMQPEAGRSRLIINPHALVIDLTNPQDAFSVQGVHPNAIPEFTRALAEAVYSVKKLIVSLYTRGTIFEAVAPRQGRQGETRNRSYPHQIIRIPLHEPLPDPATEQRGTQSSTVRPRRAKLVRGYVWGYKTRPIDEQRWIAAYWRNLAGEVPSQSSHYQVG